MIARKNYIIKRNLQNSLFCWFSFWKNFGIVKVTQDPAP